MKIASFNIQNIFNRDISHMVSKSSENYRQWIEEFDFLMSSEKRKSSDYSRLRELSFLLGIQRSSDHDYLVMRRRLGQLHVRRMTGTKEYRANSFTNWNGWIKVSNYPITDEAIENKARVIREIDPDILVLQEVEDRSAMLEFNRSYLKELEYSSCFFLDTNSPDGLGMGVFYKAGIELESVKSHVDKYDKNETPLFDKDIQEYHFSGDSSASLVLINAHLVASTTSDSPEFDRRKKQVEYLSNIYKSLRENGNEKVAILGTLNTPSYCDSLTPLLRNSDIKDCSKHKFFKVHLDRGGSAGYHSLGAYQKGINLKQKDFFLVSSGLFECIDQAGLNRKGVFPYSKDQWGTYQNVNSERKQASNHPLLWVCFNFK